MENKHKEYDLAQMQSLPLLSKERMSMQRINTAIDRYGDDGLFISDSGGKDSLVCSHLVHRCCDRIESVFADIVTQYPELRKIAKDHGCTFLKPKMDMFEVCERYGFPIFSKEISKNVHECRLKLRKYAEATGKVEILTAGFWIEKTQIERDIIACKLQEETGIKFSSNPRKLLGIYKHKEKGILTDEFSKMYNTQRYIFMLDAPFEISNLCCVKMKEEVLSRYQREKKSPFYWAACI